MILIPFRISCDPQYQSIQCRNVHRVVKKHHSPCTSRSLSWEFANSLWSSSILFFILLPKETASATSLLRLLVHYQWRTGIKFRAKYHLRRRWYACCTRCCRIRGRPLSWLKDWWLNVLRCMSVGEKLKVGRQMGFIMPVGWTTKLFASQAFHSQLLCQITLSLPLAHPPVDRPRRRTTWYPLELGHSCYSLWVEEWEREVCERWSQQMPGLVLDRMKSSINTCFDTSFIWRIWWGLSQKN